MRWTRSISFCFCFSGCQPLIDFCRLFPFGPEFSFRERSLAVRQAHGTYACSSRIGASVNWLTPKAIFAPPTTHETLIVFYLCDLVDCGAFAIFRVRNGKEVAKRKNHKWAYGKSKHEKNGAADSSCRPLEENVIDYPRKRTKNPFVLKNKKFTRLDVSPLRSADVHSTRTRCICSPPVNYPDS